MIRWLLGFGLLLSLGANAQPVEAFFGRAALGTMALSPSGRHLAATVPGRGGRNELVLADLDEQPLRFKPLAWLKDYDVGRVQWLNDKRLVFRAYDSQAGEWAGTTGLWAVDADGGDAKLLIDPYWSGFRAVQPANRMILAAQWTLFALPGDGSDDVIVAERGWSSWRDTGTATLARIDTRAPLPHRLATDAPAGVRHWLLDGKGEPQVVEAVAGGRRSVHRRDAQGRWQPIADFPWPRDEGWFPRFLFEGQLLVSNDGGAPDGRQLKLLAPDGKGLTKVLAAPGFDVGDTAEPLLDLAENKPLGWRYRLDTVYTRWTDPTMARAQQQIDALLPQRVNTILCQRCLTARRWLVLSHSDREPPAWSVFERDGGKLLTIGTSHPDVDGRRTGTRRSVRFKARDGLELPAYVTRPAQAAAGPLPVVVYVHGGPEARVSLEWSHDPVPLFLASRGYLVVEPEFRGSVGYGRRLHGAARGQWGLAMQDDLQDALRWAVAEAGADPRRACIMGASYGGYAALMGPVRHPESWRCAIAWVAPTDLERLAASLRRDGGANEAVQAEVDFLFGAGGNEAALRERSPVQRASAIGVPVLAAWGVDDRRVPVEHGRRFRDAAREAKVELDYVEYAGEGHRWMDPKTEIDFFGRAERLLARTIGRAP